MLPCGEREAMVMAPPATRDSAVSSCFHGCLAFLHRHFPPQSPPSHPLNKSLHSQQQPSPWDCSTIPKLQLPATVPSRAPSSLSAVCMAAARTVWFSFHLGSHRLSCSSVGKESACSAGDLGLILGLGRSPGEGNGNPLQYPCLEILMDRGTWWAAVHGVAKSWAGLSN